MVIKVYVSGISGNKEVKKRQQRVLLILDSKKLKYEVIDIAEPGAEESKDFVQNNATGNGATISDQNPRHPLPPQIFSDDVYCGDYNMFDLANEEDRMEEFLKLEPSQSSNDNVSTEENNLKNGNISTDEKPPEEHETGEVGDGESKDNEVPEEQDSKTEEESAKEDGEQAKNEESKAAGEDNEIGEAAVENGKEEETTGEALSDKSEE